MQTTRTAPVPPTGLGQSVVNVNNVLESQPSTTIEEVPQRSVKQDATRQRPKRRRQLRVVGEPDALLLERVLLLRGEKEELLCLASFRPLYGGDEQGGSQSG